MSGTNHVVIVLDDSAHMKGHQPYVVDGINEFVDRLSDKTWVHLYKITAPNILRVKACAAKHWKPMSKEELEPTQDYPLYGAITQAITFYTDDLDGDASNKTVMLFDVGGVADKFDNKKESNKALKKVRKLIQEADAKGWGLFFLGTGKDLVAAQAATRQAEALCLERMGVVHTNRVKAYKRLAKMTKNFFAHGTFHSLT